MRMKLQETGLAGVYLIEPEVFGDARGWFMESYSLRALEKAGIPTVFVQDNHSLSVKSGTLRGLHFQNPPMAQAKLVRCTRGAVLDVAVDIRKGSPQYKRWFSAELSAENKRQLFIPRGFAHGFAVLSDEVVFQYKCDNYYVPHSEGGILWNDPALGIDWKLPEEDVILSEKDKKNVLLNVLKL